MPYEVRMPSPDRHCVYLRGSDTPVRCYASHDEATARADTLNAQHTQLAEGGKEGMGETLNYLVNLSELDFTDENNSKWIHALPVGMFKHPLLGDMDLTSDRLHRFAESFKKNPRQIDLSIHYGHKIDGGEEAAGWVKDVEARNDGLWYFVEFVPDAIQKIKEKKFKYFSAEFQGLWKDPTGNVHEDVLFGGALTNRPFMKGMVPINLSEGDFQNVFDLMNLAEPKLPIKKEDEGGAMTKEEMDAIINGVTAKLSEQFAQLKPKDPEPKNTPAPVKLTELDGITELEEFKALAETNPLLARIAETLKQQGQQVLTQQAAMREQLVEAKLSELDAHDFVLNLPTRQLAKEVAMQLDEDALGKFLELLNQACKTSKFMVKLDEKSAKARKTPNEDDSNPTELFLTKVAQLSETKKIDQFAAMREVALAEPDLFQRYRVGEGAKVSA